MPSQCEQAVQEYKELKTLGEEFFGVYQEAKEVRDITKVKELIIGLEEKKKTLEKKIFPIEELLNRFEEKSLDYMDKLLKDGVGKNSIARGLAGLDSERAWQMRDRFFNDGTVDNDFIAEGLAGLDSDRAWKMREELLKAGADKNFIARGLAGLDSDRAWKMRDDFFNDGTVDKNSIAKGLAGLDSKRAWKMREELLKAGASDDYVVRGLTGDYTTFVWRLRPKKEVYILLKQ